MGTTDFGLHNILIYEMKNGERKEENIWLAEQKKREGKRGKYLEKKIRSVNCPTNLSELGSLTLGIYSLPKTRTEMEKEEYILRKKNWHRLVERRWEKSTNIEGI